MKDITYPNSTKFSNWTYVWVFAIIHCGSHISLLAHHDVSISDYYLPTSLAIVLINWLGPRYVLPMMYLNAVATSFLWGNPLENWPLWFLFAIPETVFPLLSWYFFRKVYQGKYWLPHIKSTILFMGIGIFIPAIIETFLLQYMLVITGVESQNTFWQYVSSNLLAEFITTFFLTVPALYYITPILQGKGLLYDNSQIIDRPRLLMKKELVELSVIFLGLLALAFTIDFVNYWYIYGFFSLYVAIRCGFGPAILTNLFILLIVYALPKFFTVFGKNEILDNTDAINTFLGAIFLFLFAAVTGRVIDDVKRVERKLVAQNESLELTNKELEQTNLELDHFIYSVSHDLSAPLKSIQGLVNISRISKDPQDHVDYIEKIGTSVRKLENYISEILDYSKNKRSANLVEPIVLKELCDEIFSQVCQAPNLSPIPLVYQLEEPQIVQDKKRLQIVLNNVLLNAIKYQKRHPGHKPYIRLSSKRVDHKIIIEIEDNGEGMKTDMQNRIFEMFYRGNEKSDGSGLGLYIAKEATAKMNGTIKVQSEYGKGSTFILELQSFDGMK